jgi:hypothetical protein
MKMVLSAAVMGSSLLSMHSFASDDTVSCDNADYYIEFGIGRFEDGPEYIQPGSFVFKNEVLDLWAGIQLQFIDISIHGIEIHDSKKTTGSELFALSVVDNKGQLTHRGKVVELACAWNTEHF